MGHAHRARRVARTTLVAAAVATSCGGAERVSDTGYVGTWALGNYRVRSVLSIARDGSGYRVRPGARSTDGTWEVRCGFDGRCEESLQGTRVFEWTVVARVEPASSRLVLEIDAKALVEGRTDYRKVDELVVGPGGTTLVAYTRERAGQVFAEGARPRRDYAKVSDRVEGKSP